MEEAKKTKKWDKNISYKFHEVCSEENITAAILRSAKGKYHKVEVINTLENMDECVKFVKQILEDEEYELMFREHMQRYIQDGHVKKERKITIPAYFPEQVIHHAVMNIVEPYVHKSFYEYTCGSIPNRGGIYGKRYIERVIKRNPSNIKYFYKLDIRHFYPSINHELLKIKIAYVVHDPKILRLLFKIIDLYADNIKTRKITKYEELELPKAYRLAGIEIPEIKEGGLITVKYGIPIGFYTSQWFANWFLSDFDHYVKQDLGVSVYVRYVDDMLFGGPNKKKLVKQVNKAIQQITELDLQVKDGYNLNRFHYYKHGVERGQFIDFLGYRFYRDRTLMREHILLNAWRKARAINKKFKKSKVTWRDGAQMMSLAGYFKYTNHYKYYNSNIKPYINEKLLKKIIAKHSRQIIQGYIKSERMCCYGKKSNKLEKK